MSEKHLKQLEEQNKPRSMEELLSLSEEDLLKEIHSLEYKHALLNDSVDLYYNLFNKMIKRVDDIKDYLNIEINKNNMKYKDTGNIEYYHKWLALIGFKEGMEEILKENKK
nr:MAG TPA: hypothetical protein [Herelleviridae sp.]